MNEKHVLLTFDYELFLGAKSGSVQNCLIKPTNELIQLFDKHAIKHAIFFVDTTYLMRLKEENAQACKDDFTLIKNQLKSLIDKGHYIFPHIHPHWLDAGYNAMTNQWNLENYSKYRFHTIDHQERERIFAESVQILKDIVKDSGKNQPISGYRAGGWSIQPFKDFKPLLKKYGIQYEFSVLPGFKNNSEAQYFDFTNVPGKVIYKFEDDPCVSTEGGSFTEFTISSLEITPLLYYLSKLWGKYLWKSGNRSTGDGSGLAIKNPDTGKTANFFVSGNKEMIALELLTKVKLPYYKRFLKKNSFMHFISHPKMLSSHNLNCFDNFLDHANANYQLQTDFLNMKIGSNQ